MAAGTVVSHVQRDADGRMGWCRRDWRALCMWRLSAKRWCLLCRVDLRQDGPRQLRLTDVAGGDEALVAASFGGYPRVAHLSRQVGGGHIQQSWGSTAYQGEAGVHVTVADWDWPAISAWTGWRECAYVGREGSLSERSVAHSPSLQLSPRIWICHTCLHTWHLITGQQSKPMSPAPLV